VFSQLPVKGLNMRWHGYCCLYKPWFAVVLCQVGKTKKVKEDRPKEEEGIGMNVKSIIIIALLMMLMLFAVHCTWVTSSAYSSPSIVLASYGQGGYVSASL
jgi:hypothetical protein